MKPTTKGLPTLLFAVSFLLATVLSAAALEVGEKAPDFKLPSTRGVVSLSSLRGKNVLINFYVLDFDPVCINQLQASAGDNYTKFQAENTEVLGISANVIYSQRYFSDFAKINYPLLSDFWDQKVIKAYGVFDEERYYGRRSYFIVDKEGVVRFKSTTPSDRETDLLPTEMLLKELKKINQTSSGADNPGPRTGYGY